MVKPPTILNVDDDQAGLYARRRLLERAGYTVVDASTGAEALRLAQELRPPVALVDVRLPDVSGLEVCRRIKSQPELAGTMVLQISAVCVAPSDRAEGLAGGADGYLAEPVEAEELLASVNALLRLHERERENRRLISRLDRSERRFRGMFEQAAVGLCLLGPDGKVQEANPKLCSIAGRSPEELRSVPFSEILHPEERVAHETQVGRLLLGECADVSAEHRLMRPDGTALWVRVALSVEQDHGGRIHSLIGIVEDIDAQKKAEQLIRQREEQFRTSFEWASVGKTELELPSRRFRAVNHQFCLLTGYSRDELLERSPRDLTHPDDRDADERAFTEILEGRQTRYFAEKRYVRKDGRVIWVQVEASVIRDADGQPVRTVAIVLDITKRKEAERALTTSEAQLRLVTDALPVLIAYVDTEERYRFNNLAYERWFGLRRGSITGMRMREVLGEKVYGLLKPYIRAALAGQRQWFDALLPYPHMGERYVTVLYAPDVDRDGSTKGFFVMVEDITDRKRTEAEILTRSRQQHQLYRLSEGINRAETLTQVYEAALDTILPALETTRAAILLFEEDGALRFKAWRGLSEGYLTAMDTHAFWGSDTRDASPITISDVGDARFDGPTKDRLLGEGIRALAFIPLLSGGRMLGKLMVYFDHVRALTEDELDLAETIARTVALAVERKTIEARLRDSEARLRAIVESAADGIVTVDAQGHIESVNPATEHMFGYGSPELVGQSVTLLMPDDYRQRYATALARARDTGAGHFLGVGREVLGRRKDGTLFPLEVTLSEVRADRGRRFTGIIRDVSSRKAAEEALRVSEERLRQAAEAARIGTWDLDLRTGRLVHGGLYGEIYGLDPATGDRSYGGWLACVHSDDRAAADAAVKRALGGETDDLDLEFRITRPDGSLRELWVKGKTTYDGKRSPVRIAGIVMDVTERKRTERDVLEWKERYETAVRASRQLLYDWHTVSNELTFGGDIEKLLGYTCDDMRGGLQQWISLIHPDDRPAFEAAIARCLASGDGFHGRYRMRHKTGRYIHVSDEGYFFRDHTGQMTRMLGFVADVTERVEAEEHLRRWTEELERRVSERTQDLVRSQDRLRHLAQELTLTEQRERQRLASELHDYLAQLLVVCRLKLGQALRKAGSTGLGQVLRELDHVLDQSLTYTRSLVAELAPPVLQQFGLPSAIKWLAEQMSRHALSVEVSVPEQRVELSEDEARLLYMSVRELLFNVVKHSGTDRASVTMSLGEGGRLEITVEDSGQGFSADEWRDSTIGQGGFGLFSIRERMEAMDGWCQVESTPGRGTKVSLGLRAGQGGGVDTACVAAAAPPSRRAKPKGSGRGGALRVLLVDDHAMVRQGLRSVLESYPDLEVVGEAGNGEEAVELAKTVQPDAVVMDVNLPRMDGVEATRRIVKDRPTTIVVGLSVNFSPHVERAMKQAGAVAMLTKELAVDQLYETIQDATLKDKGQPKLF